jgi:hypothetical protein
MGAVMGAFMELRVRGIGEMGSGTVAITESIELRARGACGAMMGAVMGAFMELLVRGIGEMGSGTVATTEFSAQGVDIGDDIREVMELRVRGRKVPSVDRRSVIDEVRWVSTTLFITGLVFFHSFIYVMHSISLRLVVLAKWQDMIHICTDCGSTYPSSQKSSHRISAPIQGDKFRP